MAFLSAGGAQAIVHGVVALMAGIFKDLIAGLVPNRKCHRPRRRESLGIGDGDLIIDNVGGDTRETLHQLQIIAIWNATDIHFAPDEIGGFNH